jgi:hypothetical protein
LLAIAATNQRGGCNVLDDPVVFRGVRYGLIGVLALTGLILSVVSLKREFLSQKPLYDFIVVVLIVGLCGLVSALTAYVQFQRPVSILLKWERAALVFKR